MENFAKGKYAVENGVVNASVAFAPRSIVLFNTKTNACFVLTAKVRKTDAESVLKGLIKAVLASKRAQLLQNANPDVEQSGNSVSDLVRPALSANVMALTDKNGNILPETWFRVSEETGEDANLRKVVGKLTKSKTLYKLVVEQGRDWADEDVINELGAWVRASIHNLNYMRTVDAALGAAADSTEKAERAEARSAKQSAKAAEARATLGVGENATEDEIKAAYRDKIKSAHPDKGGTTEDAQKINAAYEEMRKQMGFAA